MTDFTLTHDVILKNKNGRQFAPEIEVVLTAQFDPEHDDFELTDLEADGVFISQKGTEDEQWLWKRVQSDLIDHEDLRARAWLQHKEAA